MADASSARPGDRQADDRLARLLSRFALAAKAHHKAVEFMDSERAEAQARMIAALHGALVREGQKGVESLLDLVDSIDPIVAGMAAVYSIRLDVGRCLATLRRVSTEPGLLGFRAAMAIQRWESGEWEDS
jgi:hypothetical protein